MKIKRIRRSCSEISGGNEVITGKAIMIGRMVQGARTNSISRKGLHAKRHTITMRSGENA